MKKRTQRKNVGKLHDTVRSILSMHGYKPCRRAWKASRSTWFQVKASGSTWFQVKNLEVPGTRYACAKLGVRGCDSRMESQL